MGAWNCFIGILEDGAAPVELLQMLQEPFLAPGALSGSRGLAASCTAVHCGTVHYNTFYEPAVPHFSAPTMVSSPIIIINQSLSLLISSLYTEKRQGGNAQFPSFSEIKIVF